MNQIIQQAQLEKLLRLPVEVRPEALKAAIAGGWKNIQDIREKRGTGKKKFDPRDPETWD